MIDVIATFKKFNRSFKEQDGFHIEIIDAIFTNEDGSERVIGSLNYIEYSELKKHLMTDKKYVLSYGEKTGAFFHLCESPNHP